MDSKSFVTVARAALDAVALNVSRNAILDVIAAKQAAGATPDEIVGAIRDLREQADADAQAKIDAARNK